MSSSAGAAASGGYVPAPENEQQLAVRLNWPQTFPAAVSSDPVGGAPETEDEFESKAALPIFFKYMKYQIARLPADMTEQREHFAEIDLTTPVTYFILPQSTRHTMICRLLELKE